MDLDKIGSTEIINGKTCVYNFYPKRKGIQYMIQHKHSDQTSSATILVLGLCNLLESLSHCVIGLV